MSQIPMFFRERWIFYTPPGRASHLISKNSKQRATVKDYPALPAALG